MNFISALKELQEQQAVYFASKQVTVDVLLEQNKPQILLKTTDSEVVREWDKPRLTYY